MMTYDNAFARELARLINDAIERVQADVSKGWSVKDFADYRYRVGQIEAFKAVLDAFEEAALNANRR